MAVCTHSCFNGTHHGSTNGTYLVASVFGFVDDAAGFCVDEHLFRIHFMLGQIFHVDVAEVAQSGVLNEMLARATARVQPPTDKGRRLKIFYLTQASTRPPTFVAFVNSKPLFHFSYQRYLINQIRESFSLEHTPIRLVVRERGTGQVGAKDV